MTRDTCRRTLLCGASERSWSAEWSRIRSPSCSGSVWCPTSIRTTWRSCTVWCRRRPPGECRLSSDLSVDRTAVYTHKGGNVTSAGWQVTLCDPIWHVSSRSGVAILRTAIHLLLTYTHTRLTASFPRLPGWAGTMKGKTNLDFTEVRDSWVAVASAGPLCKSAHRSRQITTPSPHYSVFLQAGCSSCRPTYSVKALKDICITLYNTKWAKKVGPQTHDHNSVKS